MADDCWERALDVGWRRTTTGVVLLPASSTTAYALAGLPARCWEALGRPLGVDALAAQVAEPDDPTGDDDRIADVVHFLVAIGAVHACASSTT